MNAKVTFIFNSERNGWSETWYLKDYTSIQEASAAALNLAGYRQGLLAPGANLEAIRTSDDSVRGDSMLASYFKTSKGGATSGDENADTPWNAWLVSCRSNDLYRRSMWVRGLSDDWIIYDRASASFPKNEQFQKQLSRFQQGIVEAKASIKAIARDEATTPTIAITGGFTLADNLLSFTAPAHGVSGVQKVTIFGAQGYGGINEFNGIHGVSPTDANTLKILDTQFENIPTYLGGGKLRRRIYGYYLITHMLAMRPGKRDTGRRFFVTRGRRPVKRT